NATALLQGSGTVHEKRGTIKAGCRHYLRDSFNSASRGKVVRRLLVAGLWLIVLGSCAGPEDLPPIEQAAVPDTGYRLDTGDRLHIQVFNQEQLTGSYLVGARGSVSMPLVGDLSVRGLTTTELEQALVRRLSVERSMLVNPSISVQVEAYRPFFILGEV